MRIRLLLIPALLLLASPALADPIWQPRRVVDGCYTVNSSSGGTRIPTTPDAKRIGFYMYNSQTARAYCVSTAATTCSAAASSSNYSIVLEPATVADAMGGYWSAWITNETNYCCATASGTTKVCVGELTR